MPVDTKYAEPKRVRVPATKEDGWGGHTFMYVCPNGKEASPFYRWKTTVSEPGHFAGEPKCEYYGSDE